MITRRSTALAEIRDIVGARLVEVPAGDPVRLAEAIETAAPVVAGWRRGEVSNAAMRALLITHDIEATARRLADECCDRARQQLAALELTDKTRGMLTTVIDDLLRRNH